MDGTNLMRADDEPVLIRPSRDTDVEAMLAIYRYHIRHGVAKDADSNGGMPEAPSKVTPSAVRSPRGRAIAAS